MTWLYLNDTVLQKRNTFFVINSTAEIRQDTLSYTLTLLLPGSLSSKAARSAYLEYCLQAARTRRSGSLCETRLYFER